MKYDADGQIGEDVLEGLIQKIERISREKSEEVEKSKNIFSSMNRLTGALSRLEQQKKKERQAAKRISQVYQRLETRSAGESKKIELKQLNDYIQRFLNGAKVTGQVIEIVAGSMQVMMQTVSGVIKNQNTAQRSESAPDVSGGPAKDLASLLKPFGSFINSLVTKQQQAPLDQSAEVKEEEKTPNPFSGEVSAAIPLTKAIPSEHQSFKEVI